MNQKIEEINKRWATPVDWSIIRPHDMNLIWEIGKRAAKICNDWIAHRVLVEKDPRRFIEPDAQNISMDVALYHIRHGVDLDKWLQAGVDDFIKEFALLQQSIDREHLVVHFMVGFQFANPAKRPLGSY